MKIDKKISFLTDFAKFIFAEKITGRKIQKKVEYLKNYYMIPWKERKFIQNKKLIEFVKYSFKPTLPKF